MKRTWFIVPAGVVAAITLAWVLVAPWALERFPKSVDEVVTSEGTVSMMAPDGSGMVEQPLRVSTHIETTKSSFDETTLEQSSTLTLGSQTSHSESEVTLNRRTMERVGEGAGSYQLTFPTGLSGNETLPVWNEDTGATYDLVGTGESRDIEGVRTVAYKVKEVPVPITDAYRDSLGLPASTTPAALAAQAGIDFAAFSAALAEAVPADALAAVQTALTEPIALNYQETVGGTVDIEPETGVVVAIRDSRKTVTVSPDLSGLASLAPTLSGLSDHPAIAPVVQGLGAVAFAPPTTVLTIAVHQSDETVRSAAENARTFRMLRRGLRQGVPLAGLALTVTLLALAAAVGRRRAVAAAATATTEVPLVERRWHDVPVAVDRRRPAPVLAD